MIEFDFTNLWHLGGAVIWGIVVMFLLAWTEWHLPNNGWKGLVEMLMMATMLVTAAAFFTAMLRIILNILMGVVYLGEYVFTLL